MNNEQNPQLTIPRVSRCPLSVVYLEDCVQGLKRFDDNYFDLAIVDPPYGYRTEQTKNINFRQNSKDWNIAPTNEYFNELKRVSENQIVWGGNYFPYLWNEIQRGFIIWNKDNPVKNFADVEMAWTSFDILPKYYYYAWGGLADGIKGRNKIEKNVHPTQKPIPLYDWILQNYAKDGDLILDTHLGSGSSRIAAYKGGFNFVGFEIDQEYYEKQEKRFKNFKSQLRLF